MQLDQLIFEITYTFNKNLLILSEFAFFNRHRSNLKL